MWPACRAKRLRWDDRCSAAPFRLYVALPCVRILRGSGWALMFAVVASISPVVQSDDIVAARELLSDVVSTTPVLSSRVLSELAGGPVYLKCENLQRTGSFKPRGAYTRIARLSDAERSRGVVAASAGNHAQGVAFAAGLLGAAATVVMPERAPLPKVEATLAYGASVILHGSSVEDALEEALRFAEATGAVFIHPFDHPDIVAGQGTLGFEIIEQCPGVRTILVPSGAAGVAALLEGLGDVEPPVVVVLSGGNIDPLLLSKLLRHGLSAAGRFLVFRCRVADYPGSLAALLGLVAELGGNVLEVSHERLAPTLRVDEVEGVLQVETRGPAHCAPVKDTLRTAGDA